MPVESISESLVQKQDLPVLRATETLRVRCPNCRKLYLVQYADIQEAKPRFECIQCRSRFWLALDEIDLKSEALGIPIQLKESPRKTQVKAQVASEKVNVEPFVGSSPASRELKDMWKQVISDYANEDLHNRFISHCQLQDDLAYAAEMYASMKRLMPSDELTEAYLKRLTTMGSIAMGMQTPSHKGWTGARLERLAHVPTFLGAALIVMGIAAPLFRNMVGVGAAILFASLAVHFQLRRR